MPLQSEFFFFLWGVGTRHIFGGRHFHIFPYTLYTKFFRRKFSGGHGPFHAGTAGGPRAPRWLRAWQLNYPKTELNVHEDCPQSLICLFTITVRM